jgi:hypothetical protein
LRRTSVVQFADGNRKGAREGPKKQQSLSFDYRHSRILAASVVLSVAAAGNSINLDNSATVGSLPFGVNVLTITGIPCDSMLSWTRIFHFMRFCVFCVHHPSPALLQASVGTHSDSSPKDCSQARWRAPPDRSRVRRSSRRGQKTNLRVWIWQSGPCIRLMRAKPWLGLIVEAGAIEEELSSRLVRWLTAPKI